MAEDVITAIIPARNEAGRIGPTVAGARPHVDVVIVVDDASIDTTVEEAQAAGARVVQLPQRLGYVGALKRGFSEAADGVVVTIDGDGEHPASAIPGLVGPILEGRAEMTQGARSAAPRPSEAALSRLSSLAGPVGDSGTGMRALRTELARSLHIDGRCICGTLALEVIAKSGRILDVPIELNPIDKPRGVAWYHAAQSWYVLRAMWGARRHRRRTR